MLLERIFMAVKFDLYNLTKSTMFVYIGFHIQEDACSGGGNIPLANTDFIDSFLGML